MNWAKRDTFSVKLRVNKDISVLIVWETLGLQSLRKLKDLVIKRITVWPCLMLQLFVPQGASESHGSPH